MRITNIVITDILSSTAGLAKWDPADPAPPSLAAADRSGHPHLSAACNCDSREHGRHPAAGRLEVSEKPFQGVQVGVKWEVCLLLMQSCQADL